MLRTMQNMDSALEYLCTLEEEFLNKVNREAESELNESIIEEKEDLMM